MNHITVYVVEFNEQPAKHTIELPIDLITEINYAGEDFTAITIWRPGFDKDVYKVHGRVEEFKNKLLLRGCKVEPLSYHIRRNRLK